MGQSIFIPNEVYEYLCKVSVREQRALQHLANKTDALDEAGMRIANEQAQLLQWLLKLIQAKRVLEIGTFTGYSALAMALALPDDGTLLTCDIDDRFVNLGRPYWKEAGVDQKIEVAIAPALITLQNLLDQHQQNTFDFIFIDADKLNYQHYYEMALQLVRPNGVIAIDNVLWFGRLVQVDDGKVATKIVRELNQKILTDERVELTMLPVGGGLTLVRKCAMPSP